MVKCLPQHWPTPYDRCIVLRRKKPIEITFTPRRSTGIIRFSRMTGNSVIPIISGTLNPYISASISPTFFPRRASATARLTETVDFPTPPLPDAMDMNSTSLSGDRRSCASASVAVPRNCSSVSADSSSNRIPTESAPAPSSASTTFACKRHLLAVLTLAMANFTLTCFFSGLMDIRRFHRFLQAFYVKTDPSIRLQVTDCLLVYQCRPLLGGLFILL